MIDSIDDLSKIIPTIGIELYNNMKPFIEENYERAQRYKQFHINEKAILDIL
jgi:hypothetical protein